jgi:hypothetical protein
VYKAPALRTLQLDNNHLVEFSPDYFYLNRLESLSLKNNRITIVPEKPEVAAFEGAPAIALEGNPLGEHALCEGIPALRAHGLTVTHDGACPHSADAALDTDGDKYSDFDERRFAALFHAVPEEIDAAAAVLIADPEMPRWYLEALPPSFKNDGADPMSIDAISTQQVRIGIEGEGTLPPGNGVHHFARYRIDHETYRWDDNPVRFTATPAPGWEIRVDPPPPFPKKDFQILENTPAQMVLLIDMSKDRSFGVTFLKKADVIELDLVGDLVTFLARCFPEEDAATFDQNKADHDRDTDTMTTGPDGMPDAALLRLLQELLSRPGFGKDWRCGPNFEKVSAVWRENMERAREVLGETAEAHPETQRLMAAYATIGEYFDAMAFSALIEACEGFRPEYTNFENDMSRWLRKDESLHCNATFNKAIWKQVSTGQQPSLKLFDVFAEAVLAQE